MPALLGVVQVLGGDRLIVGNVGADQHDQIGANPVGVGAGGGGAADGGAEAGGAGRVTDAGAGIDVVGADEARDLLVGVVGFVGQPARGHIPGQALGVDFAQLAGDQRGGFVPGDPAEPFVAPVADHGNAETSELAQFLFVLVAQRAHVFKGTPVHGWHGIQAEQLQADSAEVHALHGPVVHAGGAEGAAVAAAVAQNAPGVAEIVAVFYNAVHDIFVCVGMLRVNAVGYQAGPVFPVPTFGLVFRMKVRFDVHRHLLCRPAEPGEWSRPDGRLFSYGPVANQAHKCLRQAKTDDPTGSETTSRCDMIRAMRGRIHANCEFHKILCYRADGGTLLARGLAKEKKHVASNHKPHLLICNPVVDTVGHRTKDRWFKSSPRNQVLQ